MQRILSFSASPRRMLDSSASKAMLRAFFFSGRFRISQAMPAFSSMLALMSLVSAMVLLRNFKLVQKVQAIQIVYVLYFVISRSFEILRIDSAEKSFQEGSFTSFEMTIVDVEYFLALRSLCKPVKRFGVVRENFLLGLVRDIFAAHHLANAVRPFHVPVRIIGSVHHAFVAELCDHQRQC